MLIAIIGLIGVVVGGLITGLQNAFLERVRTKRISIDAERRIRSVVVTCRRKIITALEAGRWWPEPLPIDDWKDKWSHLDPNFPGDSYDKLEKAFDSLEIINNAATRSQKERMIAQDAADDDERKHADEKLALSAAWRTGLTDRQDTIEQALIVLDARANRRRGNRLVGTVVTIFLILAAIGVSTVAVIERTTPPSSITAAVLDASLSKTLGIDFVSCDHIGDSLVDWRCTLADVGSGQSCPQQIHLASRDTMKSVAFDLLATPCSITAEDEARVAVGNDDCWDLRELSHVGGTKTSEQLPHVLKSDLEAGCI
jgi:hypothetical protein